METVTITKEIYYFADLPKDVKAKIIERERNDEHRLEYDWWDCDIDNFIEDAAKNGWVIEKEDVQFRLAYSQGDGACFDGYIDITQFLKANKALTKFPLMARYDKEGLLSTKIYKNHYATHYCHSSTRWFELDYDDVEREYPNIYENKDRWNKLVAEAEKLEAWIEEEREKISDKLYRTFQDTYEGLQSDEAITENLIANEARFEIDGTPFYD